MNKLNEILELQLGNSRIYLASIVFLITCLLLFCSCEFSQKNSLANPIVQDKENFQTISSNLSTDSLYQAVMEIKEDSVLIKKLSELAYLFYKREDSVRFRFWNKKLLEFSVSIKDSSGIAKSYWGLGNFFYQNNFSDSAYFNYNKAYNFYSRTGKEFSAARMLLNMAIIQTNIKDYVGSEVSTIKAIKILKPLKKDEQLSMAYNNLGIIYNELEEYEKSIRYHQLAIKYQNKNAEKIKKASSLNNIGVVYKNSGKHIKATEIFNSALSIDSIPTKDPELYAMLIDNLAHARLLSEDTTGVIGDFFKALEIRKKIDHKAGIIINKIHLSQYFLFIKDTAQAIKYAREANRMAYESNNFRDILSSLLILSRLDTTKSETYLRNFIAINDSLSKEERVIQNKFARIRFETDEFIAENENLNQQKNMIIGGSVLAFGFVFLLFINVHQRNKNKRLLLEQEQQKSNEAIYNLLLVQQQKLEEGRNTEKNRISRELHDGILGKLFGIRFMLESLGEKSDKESLKLKLTYIRDLKNIEEEIRAISHDLNSDLLSSQISFINLVEELLLERQVVGNFEFVLNNDQSLEWEKFNSEIKINLYRIIQEAINNIIKHASATYVSISFIDQGQNLEVVISDNGKGFDIEKNSKGIGLKNIESRLKILGGKLNPISGDKGTKLIISIPKKIQV